MEMNRRGEVTVAVAVGIAVISLLVGTLAPNLNPFNRLFGGGGNLDASKQTATWTRQDEIQTPVLLKQGETVAVGTKVERHYNTGTEEKTPEPTLGQKIGRFFGGLTTWGLIFVLVSVLFFGGAPLVWVFRKYAVVKQTLKATVSAIREADEETYAKLKPHLAAKHDRRDRKVIDKVKAELQ